VHGVHASQDQLRDGNGLGELEPGCALDGNHQLGRRVEPDAVLRDARGEVE